MHHTAKGLTIPDQRLPCDGVGGDGIRDVEHGSRGERAALEGTLHSQRRCVLTVKSAVPEAPHGRLRHLSPSSSPAAVALFPNLKP